MDRSIGIDKLEQVFEAYRWMLQTVERKKEKERKNERINSHHMVSPKKEKH